MLNIIFYMGAYLYLLFWAVLAFAVFPWHFALFFISRIQVKNKVKEIFSNKGVVSAQLFLNPNGQIDFHSCNGVAAEFMTSGNDNESNYYFYHSLSDEATQSALIEMNIKEEDFINIQESLSSWGDKFYPFATEEQVSVEFDGSKVSLQFSFVDFLLYSPKRMLKNFHLMCFRKIKNLLKQRDVARGFV